MLKKTRLMDPQKLRAAQRLARTIASDILLYNRDKVERGIKADNLFSILEAEIREGEELFYTRVDAALIKEYNLLERALVDILVFSQAELECDIW